MFAYLWWGKGDVSLPVKTKELDILKVSRKEVSMPPGQSGEW